MQYGRKEFDAQTELVFTTLMVVLVIETRSMFINLQYKHAVIHSNRHLIL